MPEFYVIFVRKINKIPEFYMIYARKINKMPEFYTIFVRKKIVFARIWGGGGLPPMTPSPTPMVTWHAYCNDDGHVCGLDVT